MAMPSSLVSAVNLRGASVGAGARSWPRMTPLRTSPGSSPARRSHLCPLLLSPLGVLQWKLPTSRTFLAEAPPQPQITNRAQVPKALRAQTPCTASVVHR